MLIGLEQLQNAGLLARDDLADSPGLRDRVDYGSLIPWKIDRLYRSYQRFHSGAPSSERTKLADFENASDAWLGDFVLFMAIKEAHDGSPWTDWEQPLRDRDLGAIEAFRAEHSDRIGFHIYLQWQFHTQWHALRALASEQGIRLVGDLPIFVAHDSADVWAGRDLFELDDEGQPSIMAGVPPDYFSETGQLWGNPIYRWDRHRDDDFAWWHSVIAAKLDLYDHVRIDHFRGFAAHWAVPQGETTAINGEWLPSPGRELFALLEERIGRLPLIAEDLGVITPDVVELINTFGFARMKVLQFAFDSGEDNDYLPHTYEQNAVVYTGTHDNDTIVGWLEHANESDRTYALRYVNGDGVEPHWDFIRCAIASTAQFAIVPMQDLLGLGSDSRMNVPGTTGGNWTWRLGSDRLSDDIASKLGEITATYGRA